MKLPSCHPERSETKSRDLGTDFTAKVDKMRRFLDSLRSLEMTYLVVLTNISNHFPQ